MSIRRGSIAATSRSWVMTTIVVPSAVDLAEGAISSAPVAVSRLPVGSSARTMAGRPSEGAGDRDALALAARGCWDGA
jgi:hypothetical protein